ncbi:MAG TPA: PilT/PilU family type 4a pilus ATPase [Kofleriaceae bacterium]|jgi:twitching motility protein PilT|nr:PilT/PilU family type 4a pilus ATPase [Kofleriaceae bacterium]
MDRTAFLKLLAFGIERAVSDIHFEVGYPPHYRLHGELLGAIKVPPLTAADTEAIARMILEDRGPAIDFTRRFAELDVAYALAQRGRFRVSIFRQRGAVGIVMRLIPIQVPALDQLDLPPVLTEIAGARRGLILVTGATGSGKTTTLAAMLRYINETRHAHIVTIEDPIELIHDPQRCMIIQREVGVDTESFSGAMTAAMRQDPDVILVGEIRDRATAAACLEAAETGHLVLSSVSTPDAVAAVQRYLGLFEPDARPIIRDRLGDCLEAIVALRLVAGKDGGRRIPAVEILRGTRAIRECVRAGRMSELSELIRKGRELCAMQLFDQHLIDLVNRGLVTREAAIYASSNPEELERSLHVE